MITLLDKSKVSFFDFFYLFCVIILAGQASGLVRQFGDLRTVGNSIFLILTIAFAIHKKVNFDSRFFSVIGVFVLYCFFSITSTGSSNYLKFESSRLLMMLFVAFVVCKGYGHKFLIISETILYYLAIISLIGWILLLLIPNQFTEFLSHISLSGIGVDDGSDFAYNYKAYNIFIYTVNGVNHIGELSSFYSIIRNAGFAWEPGSFSCFMCFALCFNIMRMGLRLKQNRSFIIFLLALLTTQSTTGYVTFAMVSIVWIASTKKLYWLFLLIPLILWGINLPFISEKIMARSEDISSASLSSVSQGAKIDRLFALSLYWEEFLQNPILGYGFSESTLMKYGVTAWSGIGKMLAQYGIIMFSLFFLLLTKSGKHLCKNNNTLSGFIIVVAMIGMMVSYGIWDQPFFAAIWMSCLFIPTKRIQLEREKYSAIYEQ